MAQKRVLKRGVLIAIEGIDGAGKSTQSRLLFEKLKEGGYPVVLLHEPTNGQWGEKIRELSTNGRDKTTAEEELELFLKDRLEDVEINIRPKMLEKNVVIMDRYYFSNVTYQGARGIDPDYIEKLNEKIAPKPDIVIILDISSPESSNRIKTTRKDGPNHFEKEEYLERVRQLFLKQFLGRESVVIIDGDGTHSELQVLRRLWNLVEPIIRKAEET